MTKTNKSRKLTVDLYRLLDLVVAVQMDGIDTVHEFLGEMVGRLTDGELRSFIQTLARDGYDRRDLDEADSHLRRWRARYLKATQPERQCRQCFDIYEPTGKDDGFCSDHCAHEFDRQLTGDNDDYEYNEGFET